MSVSRFLSRILFPSARCMCCDEPRRISADKVLCESCRAALDKLRITHLHCPRCLSFQSAGKQCSFCAQDGMRGIDRAYAPYQYRDEARQLVLRLKFGPFEEAGLPLARAMVKTVSGQSFDYLVPVPLHRLNQRERGFNQAELLCQMIQRHRPDLALLNALEKPNKTKRQSTLSKEDRATNAHQKYRAVANVRDKWILLVDDVRTTGATTQDCARALLEAGAAGVSLLSATVAD
ncbi:MAG: ComF family protein [Christensenellales bacterium]|jgi:competence protein ComFC